MRGRNNTKRFQNPSKKACPRLREFAPRPSPPRPARTQSPATHRPWTRLFEGPCRPICSLAALSSDRDRDLSPINIQSSVMSLCALQRRDGRGRRPEQIPLYCPTLSAKSTGEGIKGVAPAPGWMHALHGYMGEREGWGRLIENDTFFIWKVML